MPSRDDLCEALSLLEGPARATVEGSKKLNITLDSINHEPHAIRALFGVRSEDQIQALVRAVEDALTLSNAGGSALSSATRSSRGSDVAAPDGSRKRGRPRGSIGAQKQGGVTKYILTLLLHFRLGVRGDALGTLFDYSSSQARHVVLNMRQALYDSPFMREWLRFPRDLDELSQWTPPSLDEVYKTKNEKLACVIDATYVWLPVSSDMGNQGFTKKQRSDQYKGQPFLKFLTVAAPNGRCMLAFGPYHANSQDSDVLLDTLEKNPAFLQFLQLLGESGVVLLNRGFPHVDQVFEKLKLKTKWRIPGHTDEAGLFSSRDIAVQHEITNARAVVEQMHAVWRRFDIFSVEFPLAQVPPCPTTDRTPLKEYVCLGFCLANYCYEPPRRTE